MVWWRYARSGQKVVYIGRPGTPEPHGFWKAWQRYWDVTLPQHGVVYTVRSIRATDAGAAFIRLREIHNPIIEFLDAPDDEPWFQAKGFRPMQTTESGFAIISKILDRAPVKEDA